MRILFLAGALIAAVLGTAGACSPPPQREAKPSHGDGGTGDAGVLGTAYYVDCAGDDGRSGTSPDTAWQTIAKANAATLAAGDELLFKRGCTFAGELAATWSGTASAPIVIGAYGTGAAPLIRNDAAGTSTS